MDKRYLVSGLFNLEVEGESMRQARETAERILQTSGIDGKVIQVEEVYNE